MPGLAVFTPPTQEPVTLDEAKQHLAVLHNDDDALITGYIAMARSFVESCIKSALMPTVYDFKMNNFPAQIDLPMGPIFSETNTVTYVNDAGVNTVLSPALYQFSTGEYGAIRPSYGNVWPVTRPQLDAVTVRFTAGWPSAAALPPAIRLGLLLCLEEIHANRGGEGKMPTAARNFLIPFVRH